MNIKELILGLVSWKLMVLMMAILATAWVPLNPRFGGFTIEQHHPEPYLAWVWANFDGIHYLNIAYRGYDKTQPPFFPLYPGLIHGVSQVTGIRGLWVGLFISHLAFLASIWVILQLLKVDKYHRPGWFLTVWLLFPTAFFYGAIYNDSVFFLCASTSILLARHRRWRWAAIAAAVATLTRLNGLALGVFLGLEYLWANCDTVSKTWQWSELQHSMKQQFQIEKIWRSGIWWGLLIPAIFLSYLGFIQWKLGDWQLLFTAMATWNQHSITFPPQVIWRYIKILIIVSPMLSVFWVALLEFIMWAFYMVVFSSVWRQIRLSYWIFIVVSILIPWLTGSLAGMPRYALHLYPFFLGLAWWVETRSLPVKVVYFINCLGLMFIILGLFTRGYFIT